MVERWMHLVGTAGWIIEGGLQIIPHKGGPSPRVPHIGHDLDSKLGTCANWYSSTHKGKRVYIYKRFDYDTPKHATDVLQELIDEAQEEAKRTGEVPEILQVFLRGDFDKRS